MEWFLGSLAPARGVVVPVLVIGWLVIAATVSIAVGAERPYPGVALGSGLLLELERAQGSAEVDGDIVGRLEDLEAARAVSGGNAGRS